MSWWDVIEERLQNPVIAGLAVATIGTLTFVGVRRLLDGGLPSLPDGVVPPRQTAAPFAELSGRPVWPVSTSHKSRGVVSYTDIYGETHGNWARQFHALRDDGRYHVGVDLYGYNGDPVLAIADGTVVAVQSFHLGSWAILVEHDGFVALYGEVRPQSWKEFGVAVGTRVRGGQPIARIACMVGSESNCESHMLHFEAYAPGTRENEQWYGSTPAPQTRDPTWLLLAAAPPGVNV